MSQRAAASSRGRGGGRVFRGGRGPIESTRPQDDGEAHTTSERGRRDEDSQPAIAAPESKPKKSRQRRKPKTGGSDEVKLSKEPSEPDSLTTSAAAAGTTTVSCPIPVEDNLAKARECLERQAAEVEILMLMDADSFVNINAVGRQVRAAREFLEDSSTSVLPPMFAFDLVLASTAPMFRNGVIELDATTRLSASVQLPRRYPLEQVPLYQLDGPDLVREARNELLRVVNQTSADAYWNEHLQLLGESCRQAFNEVMGNIAEDAAQADAESKLAVEAKVDFEAAIRGEFVLGRRCVYYHHIIGSAKRQCIATWAKQFQINGWAKIGYPGILVVEGPECAVTEYIRWLQRLRWKLMVVRGEERVDIRKGGYACLDHARVIPPHGVIELSDPSDLAARCRDSGIEDPFLTSMKKYRTGGATASGGVKIL